MVENEIFTAQANNFSESKAKSSAQSLITLERSQKLDLLAHLITNLKQSLVVCGPVGIGKTTLLNVLEQKASSDWHSFYIQGNQQLSFESIQDQLSELIKKERIDSKIQDLNGYLAQLARLNQKLVLIIDDAGFLVPGLIDALNRYSLANPSLRIIFALTQDELYVKNSSDRTIEDCHFIELPPLTEKQCGEFLQNLSGKPGAAVSFNAINDNMIAHLYQETHGIPGRIMKALPHLSEYGHVRTVRWFPVVLIASVVTASMVYWVWEDESPVQPIQVKPAVHSGSAMKEVELITSKVAGKDQIASASVHETVAGEAEVEDDKTPVALVKEGFRTLEDSNKPPSGKPIETTDNGVEAIDSQLATRKQVPAPKMLEAGRSALESKQESAELVPVKQFETQAESVPSVEPPKPVTELNGRTKSEETIESELSQPVVEADDREWLYRQPPKNYTLQLIALSNHQSLIVLMKKYSSWRRQFKYIKTVSNQKEKYILLYGSFDSYASAGRAMQKLPGEFRKSWVRRFKVLQNDVKKTE